MDWIIIIALYALGMGLFTVLGGLSAAAESLKRWGKASSTIRDSRASASS
jgi:hypothetical protein